MHMYGFATVLSFALGVVGQGYLTGFTTLPGNTTFNFGRHYAVLNLDLINAIVGSIASTPAGKKFINSTATWIDAVHAQDPLPLTLFTRIYVSNSHHPEVGPETPFAATLGPFINATASNPATQIYPAFKVNADYDVVLQKNRYYAGLGNQLENILRSQLIDTVILSGVRTSGVILSTAYQLFDLNYNVYVICENSIETPPNSPHIDQAIKQGIIPKFPANVITLEQALAALKRSGPAIY